TTPEAIDLQATFKRMLDAGDEAVAMEVSSHAIELGRVSGIRFAVKLFTNLTRDHLDYHGTMDGYYAAKRRLFDQLKPGGRAAVNVEDAYGRRLAAELPDAVTFGEGGAVSAASAMLTARGTVAEIATPSGRFAVTTPLLGRYNLLNLLAVVAAAEALALPHAAVVAAAAAQRPIAGRLEPIDRGQPFPVFVDYAHTDAALEAALRSVR